MTETKVKEVYLRSTSQIAGRLPPCLQDALELYDLFKNIQSTLNRIQELAVDEIGDLPQMVILASLWNQLARPNEHAEYRSHKELLEDLTGFYTDMSKRIVETVVGLMRMNSEMKEFRDELASTKLTLRDFSLNVIMNTMRESTKRLESGREALRRIQSRKRKGKPSATSTMTVYPN